jgi:hypothetical protein
LREVEEADGGQIGNRALPEFSVNLFQLDAQGMQARSLRREQRVLQGFAFDGLQVPDFKLELAAELTRVCRETLSSAAMRSKLQPWTRSWTKRCWVSRSCIRADNSMGFWRVA